MKTAFFLKIQRTKKLPMKNLVAVENIKKKTMGEITTKSHLVTFESNQWRTATSKSLKQDEELIKAGFEHVTERDRVKIFKK